MHESILDNLQSGKTLFKWINFIFAFYGIDPMNFNAVLHYSIVLYISIHIILTCLTLSYSNGESNAFLYTVMEIGGIGGILVRIVTYGANQKKIAKILAQIVKDYEDPLLYKNLKEVHVALKYIKQVKTYLMVAVPLSFVNETMYFLKPLLTNSFKVPSLIDFQNVTTYVLPYSVSFHIENDRDYWLAFIYLIPMCYCAIFCLGMDISLILALLAHVCGQLALLSECVLPQIANDINTFSINTSFSIQRHNRLIRMAKEINKSYDWLLLNQYVIIMFFNCTIGYLFLIAISQHQKVFILTYLISIINLNMVLFLYCHAGQCLYNESKKLSDSLYHSCWYNLNPLQMKHQLIFLIQSQICLRLTGKNICTFSYESFLNVIKSSMAYLSVLRKIL